jgi:hypothetical protein
MCASAEVKKVSQSIHTWRNFEPERRVDNSDVVFSASRLFQRGEENVTRSKWNFERHENLE